MREQAMDREALFDDWAADYDQHTSARNAFPFAGYEDVLQRIVEQADTNHRARFLDVGTGTGNLAARLTGENREIWGTDFSEKMLEAARAKCSSIRFVRHDLLGSWPSDLPARFDRIVSAYVFHEFPLETKLRIIKDLAANHLTPSGRIVIGDIAFPSVKERAEAHERWATLWDEDEAYWAFDETRDALSGTALTVSFDPISPCAGVFVFQQATLDETNPGLAE